MTTDVRDYLTTIPYPDRFHPEHAPAWLHATLTALGFQAPKPGHGRWCEIGCGTGYGACILAAANPDMSFVGIDINAEHIAIAQQRAAEAGLTNLSFIRQDIAEPDLDLGDLGRFDFIVAHGIYSWVSAQVRDAIMAFAGGALGAGGVLYLHYMTHPGASAFASFHNTFRQMNRIDDRGAVSAIEGGLALLENLQRMGAGYFVANPTVGPTLGHLRKEDAGYIAHEYLNENFAPLHVAEVIQAGMAANLRFVGSATPIENIDAVSIPADAAGLIRQQKDPVMRETLKDLARNQSLRRDLYMREAIALDDRAHTEALHALEFGLLPNAPVAGPITLDTRIGAIQLSETVVDPVLARLRGGACSFAQLARAIPGMPVGMLNQTLHLLMGAGIIHPHVPRPCDDAACERLNAVLLRRMHFGAAVPALSSSQIGSGLRKTGV